MKTSSVIYYLCFVFLFAFSFKGVAQQTFGVKLNGGISKMSTSSDFTNVTQENYYRPSGNAGLFYNLQIDSTVLIGGEVLWVQIEGREHTVIPMEDMPNFIGEHWIHDFDRHISYIGIPVYLGFKIKKLIINLGFQTSFKVVSKTNHKGQYPQGGGEIIIVEDDRDWIGIANIVLGLRGGIIFNLTNRVGIEANYYSWNDNTGGQSKYFGVWQGQQITLGFRYSLNKK